MDIFERLLAISFSLGILGLGMLLRRLSGSWATPAALFCGFWFLFSFIPLLALYYLPVNPLALGYLFLCCLAFSLPSLGVDWQFALRSNAAHAASRGAYLASPLIRAVFVTSFFTSVLFILLDLLVQGISLTEMISNFFVASNSYLVRRYEGVIVSNLFGQWGLIAAYMCVIFGGLVHAQPNALRRRWLVLTMIMTPPILVMLVQAAKGLFFLAIALVLGAHLVQRVLTDKRPYVDLVAIAGQAKYLLIASPFILASFLARGLYEAEDIGSLLESLQAYLASYAFLHIYAFSDWFSFTIGQPASQNYSSEPLAYGYYTFIALFKLLGSTKTVPPGVYAEYFAFANLSPGNIYTIFRGMVTDFGLAGTLLVLSLFGAFFNVAYRRILTVRYPTISVALIFLFVMVLYTSYIASALIWNTTYLVTVLVALILVANKHYAISRAQRSRHFGASRANLPS